MLGGDGQLPPCPQIARGPPLEEQDDNPHAIDHGRDAQGVGNHPGKEQHGNRAGVVEHKLEREEASALLLRRSLLHDGLRGNIDHVQRDPQEKGHRAHNRQLPALQESDILSDNLAERQENQANGGHNAPQRDHQRLPHVGRQQRHEQAAQDQPKAGGSEEDGQVVGGQAEDSLDIDRRELSDDQEQHADKRDLQEREVEAAILANNLPASLDIALHNGPHLLAWRFRQFLFAVEMGMQFSVWNAQNQERTDQIAHCDHREEHIVGSDSHPGQAQGQAERREDALDQPPKQQEANSLSDVEGDVKQREGRHQVSSSHQQGDSRGFRRHKKLRDHRNKEVEEEERDNRLWIPDQGHDDQKGRDGAQGVTHPQDQALIQVIDVDAGEQAERDGGQGEGDNSDT